jgi:hypothetical protein
MMSTSAAANVLGIATLTAPAPDFETAAPDDTYVGAVVTGVSPPLGGGPVAYSGCVSVMLVTVQGAPETTETVVRVRSPPPPVAVTVPCETATPALVSSL